MAEIHNTPSLEERLIEIEEVIKSLNENIAEAKKNIEEGEKNLISLLLRRNELMLMMNIRDGKLILVDAETGETIKTNFIKKA